MDKFESVVVPQKIARIRRTYNQWVSNQTIEDFSLRFTAKKARKWSALRVGNTALGAISFLALESIGGSITLQYGFVNAAAAIVAVCVLIFATGLPIGYFAAKHGIDIDLLSRGAGFGYIGSTITSLIYASFTFIFFAIEAAIMSTALELFFGVPLFVGYLVSSLVIIPIVVHGFTFISRFQLWTQPIWLILHILPFAFIATLQPELVPEWTHYTGLHGAPDGKFNIVLFGAASAVLFSLSAQIGEQVDFLRFLPPKTHKNRFHWWFALLSAGPGWIIVGGIKIFAGSFLAFLAVKMMVPADLAIDPSHMYKVAFEFVFSTPGAVTLAAATFVIISQIKINVTNAYAGSIAWSNFFSRLTHSHPGRVVWLVFNVTIAFLLITLGVYRALEQILGLYSIIAVAWVGTLSADLLINKPLKLSPKHVEFRRAYLYDINPVGVGSISLAVLAAAMSYTGLFGETFKALSSYLALGVSFCAAPLIAWFTDGKYYIAREPEIVADGASEARCCICESTFEVEDMAVCPVYDGAICSLCCSLDARCHDACKVNSRYSDQIIAALKKILPTWLMQKVNSSIGHYLGLQLLISAIIGGVLGLVYLQTTMEQWLQREVIQGTLLQVFFILIIISGVATWLFVLARESAKVAQEESSRQTLLLSKEFEAHKITDVKLQQAKESAEAANSAKSRFVVGLNHEFRTPLNAILGYSQIVERDDRTPAHQLDAIKVIRRSSEHLTDLIDGLLNVSRIEAEHFALEVNEIWFKEFLTQIVNIFRLEAQKTGIEFRYVASPGLPAAICMDEKRLQQILINLLSNAMKFTSKGWVSLSVTYNDNQLSFSISDSGIGVSDADRDRIFEPFERAGTVSGETIEGTGLGLAITKLLVARMGGTIELESAIGRGSTFEVTLPTSIVSNPTSAPTYAKPITGYSGPARSIIITDDDLVHCEMIMAILKPLGFTLFTAKNADECLKLTKLQEPDLYLLDISMPGMSGLELAAMLRKDQGRSAKIIIISANAVMETTTSAQSVDHDGYLMKPLQYQIFMQTLKDTLGLEWVYQGDEKTEDLITQILARPKDFPPTPQIEELMRLGRMGNMRGIQDMLDQLETDYPGSSPVLSELRHRVREFRLPQFMALLDALEASRGKQN
ncbi:MAG: response regulator [Rhodobacteraceae bacterium]|nr:response regulator [Paracoccaceae bacterium]